ncbi:MAG: SPOR domain-containing protein [Mangrovibacterium sp.]
MNILAYIEELLLLNDCVIIPEFGGFIANYSPATAVGSSFAPPSNVLSFNGKLNFNDGLLINHVSTEENISYLSAKHRVEALVAEMNCRLTEGETIEIPAVGSLQYDEQRQVIFTAAASRNINAYGLSDFTYQSLLGERLRSTMPKRVDAQAIRPPKKVLRRALWATPLLIVLFAIPFRSELVNLQESSVLPIERSEVAEAAPIVAEEQPETIAPTLEAETPKVEAEAPVVEAEAPIVKQEAPMVKQEAPAAPKAEVAKKEKPIVGNRYHIIAGAFAERRNADKLVESLCATGLEAQNIGVVSGKHYVSASSFATIEEAREANQVLARSYRSLSGAWVFTDNR